MTEYKLAAIDLDGTALDKGGWLNDVTRTAIEKAIADGVIVVPTTGRTLSEIPDELMEIPGIRFAIVSNGASVMDLENDEEIYSDLIPHDAAMTIFTLLLEQNADFVVYSEGVSFCDDRFMPQVVSYFGGRGSNFAFLTERIRFVNNLPAYFEKAKRTVEKITVNKLIGEVREKVEKALAEIPSIGTTTSDSKNLEINSVTAHKGSALKQLTCGLGIEAKQVLAIGDGNNDLEMLQFAGFSVAMGNAPASVRLAASYVTVTNEDNGLAVAFRKFL